MISLLRLQGVARRFAGLTAVDAVSMSITRGEIRGLIGPNGAGKTTLLNVISGLIRATDGVIELNATDITAVSAERRAAMGVRRTFQNLKLFDALY